MRDADAPAAQKIGHSGERLAPGVAGRRDGEDEIAEGESRAGPGGFERMVHATTCNSRRAMRRHLCAAAGGRGEGVSIRDSVVRKPDTAG